MLGSSFTLPMFLALKRMGGTESVVCGGVETDGLRDFESAESAGDMAGVYGVNSGVLIPATALPALVNGASLTVGGVSYKARSVTPHGDGELVRVELAR